MDQSLEEIVRYIKSSSNTSVSEATRMITMWSNHQTDKAVTEAQRAGNGLYSEIIRRLEPFFPKDTRDLDWDVLPSTIAGLAQPPVSKNLETLFPKEIAKEIGLKCAFFGDEDRGPCFDYAQAEQILSNWLKEAVFSELGEKYANWDALLHALRCARDENKRLTEKS